MNPTELFIPFDRAAIEQSIPARFEQQVQRHPHRLALVTERHSFTYAQLNGQANQMAWALLDALGPEPEPVAMLLDQGHLPVFVILGILKAGKFYLPLDPLDPPARRATILTEVEARLIITDGHYLPLVQPLTGADPRVLNAERLKPQLATKSPELSLQPDTLAYVYFTSGSTGPPKGVVDNHRNVLHNIMRYTNSLQISPGDRLSLIQSPTFSGTVSSLFGALLNGATVCPFNLRYQGTEALGAWLTRVGITVYHSVPTIFRSLPGDASRFPSVRLIRLEGDSASLLDVEFYRQHFSSTCRLVNGLGTTETGLCRQYFISQASTVSDKTLPLGYPVVDMEITLLNEAGQQVGAHQVGEITVTSHYLSLGYWQRPEQTAAVFIPAVGAGEARSYRTGDLGRLREDGCLEYLGRKNFQLNVRGHRVEPAEIERVLLGLSFIRETAVMTYPDRQEEAQLVAYVVCSPGAKHSAAEIRRLLRRHLQDALIPKAYVFLTRLPLTSHGKIDRRNLPEPEVPAPIVADVYSAPQTALEQTIAGIWAEVFLLDRVSINDDFLALGGDSIKAMQILSRLRKQLEVELSFSTLFEHPRVFELAEYIANSQKPASQPTGR